MNKEKQRPVPRFRRELKHRINEQDYWLLRQRLQQVASLDSNGGSHGRYQIRSLYFDTPDDKALREKLDGVNEREKFRIRYYNFDDSYIRLEKKSKCNGIGRKQSARLTREQCDQLLAGETDWMPGSGDALLTELYGKMKFQQLRPRTIVDYMREAYVYPAGNVRVTIDSQIRTGLRCIALFDRELPTVPTGHPGTMILEVKFDDFLPDLIRDLIQLGERQNHAFSKYAVCRRYE